MTALDPGPGTSPPAPETHSRGLGISVRDVLAIIDRPKVDHERDELEKAIMRAQLQKLHGELGISPPTKTTLDALAQDRRDYVILGPKGRGKSYTAERLAEAYRRRGLAFARFMYAPKGQTCITDAAKLPHNSIILVDENVIAFAAFRGRAAPAEIAEAIAMARHADRSFIYVGQHSGQVPAEILKHEYALGVKPTPPLRSILMARAELVEDLKTARRDLAALPMAPTKWQPTTWWSLEDESRVWTST